MKRFFLVFALFLLFPLPGNTAMFDPAFDFSVIQTEHFTIYYHQGLEDIAGRAAATAEEIQGKLTKLLQWQPQEKTHIVIADNSDFANGVTTVVPYNLIYLQTAPPSMASSLGEYDNWLRLLIVHEYAHVLTSDPVQGYSKRTRQIFGKVVPLGDLLSLLTFVATGPPNMMMPRWWHEGFSTWAETELTTSGRGRSSYYQMLYRTAVADDNLPGIDKINGDLPSWPEGNSPYIFGSSLIQYIAATYGKELPGSISIQQSGRFPYFINQAPQDQISGKGYATLYGEMLAQMIQEQNRRIDSLKTEPFTVTRRIGKLSVSETNPRYSPDGKLLACNSNDRHSYPVIIIRSVDGTEVAKFRRNPGDGTIAWAKDNGSLFFTQAELSREGNNNQDIYRYDLKTKKIKRLTKSLRATEPDISPDGNRLAVVINSRGSQNIGLLELKDLAAERTAVKPDLLTNYKEGRISSPRWSPDGKNIAFALTDSNGRSSLNLLTLEAAPVRELLTNGHAIDAPTWAPDGKTIFFSSNATGVFNIYSYKLGSGEAKQITHLLSGAFSPDISPVDQSLAIEEYSSFGATVAVIPQANLRKTGSSAPSINSDLYPVNSLLTEAAAPLSEPLSLQSKPFDPLPTLLPRFWLPTLIPEGATSSAVGAMTAGQDVLGYHSYLGKILYGTGFNKEYFEAIYRYGRFVPTYSLHGYALPATYSNLIRSGDYTEIERGLVASVSTPLGSLESGWSVNGGYHLRDQQHLTTGRLVAYNGKPVFAGRHDSFFAGVNYSNQQKYPWSITTEEGRNISLKFEYFGKASGSEIDTREATASWEEFFPLFKHHNILTRVNAGIADGEQTAQQSFQLGGATSFLNPFGLRGYDSYFTAGNRIATGTVEYRFPISYLLHGFGTQPLFLDRLHGALFVDAGESWNTDRSFKGKDIMTGAGMELRIDLTVGYWLKITPAIGYAHGFDKVYGTDQVYFNIYANL